MFGGYLVNNAFSALLETPAIYLSHRQQDSELIGQTKGHRGLAYRVTRVPQQIQL